MTESSSRRTPGRETRTRVAILGSTGSIGCSALAVVEAYRDRLEVVGLAAGENAARFAEQVARFRPRAIAMSSAAALADARASLGSSIHFEREATGVEGLVQVATHPDVDIVLFASSGTAGLDAVLAAIEAGKTIALANKEVLVMAGAVVTEAARRRGVRILPVDSEHNAIHQCLHGRGRSEIERLILTASGGPFRELSDAELDHVTPERALRHPTWQMGQKITIDSATLMNKGLEVIEAHWLFDVPGEGIDVVVHPQSIVHSMVEFKDGSVIAQLGVTDMRLPIQYAFSYPERWDGTLERLDLTRAARLDFFSPDKARFPCLALAFRALKDGGALPIVLNAANEVAVAAFLARRLPFRGISRLIERAIEDAERRGPVDVKSLTDVREADAWARRRAEELLQLATI
jgi:1-deoxy-D-xylulose-5-phosphate reductoisomerase